MRLDPNPLFRRVITPWYDSNFSCILLIVAMVVVAFFSIVGWVTTRQTAAYHAHTWLPVTLLVLSLLVLFSVIVRLIRRSVNPAVRRDESDN
jgi:hypothetical protein